MKRKIKSLGVQGFCEYGQDQWGMMWYKWPHEGNDKWRPVAT